MTKSTFQLRLNRNCQSENRARIEVTWTFDSEADRREIFNQFTRVLDKYIGFTARVYGDDDYAYDPCHITLRALEDDGNVSLCVWSPSFSDGGLLVLIARIDTLFQDIASWARVRGVMVNPKAVVCHGGR